MNGVKWRRVGDEAPPRHQRVLVKRLEDPRVEIASLVDNDWSTVYDLHPALYGDLWTELPTPPKHGIPSVDEP